MWPSPDFVLTGAERPGEHLGDVARRPPGAGSARRRAPSGTRGPTPSAPTPARRPRAPTGRRRRAASAPGTSTGRSIARAKRCPSGRPCERTAQRKYSSAQCEVRGVRIAAACWAATRSNSGALGPVRSGAGGEQLTGPAAAVAAQRALGQAGELEERDVAQGGRVAPGAAADVGGSASGCGVETTTRRETTRGCSAATVQAIAPPHPAPTIVTRRAPRARTRPATSPARVHRS